MDISLTDFHDLADKHDSLGLPERVLGKLFGQILSGLDYLYDQWKVVHRSITIDAILLNSNGQAKLIDLDLTMVHVDQSEDLVNRSILRSYRAPERWGDRETNNWQPKYDPRSDVWSLALTMFVMANDKQNHPSMDKLIDAVYCKQSDDVKDLKFKLSSKYTTCFQNFIDQWQVFKVNRSFCLINIEFSFQLGV